MEALWKQAVTRGDVDTLRRLLASGVPVDARDEHGQTGLMLAAHRGHSDVVAALVAAGADLNVTAKYHLSALMLAVIGEHADVARLLARAGADLGIQGSGAPGFAGKTAYDLALARGMHELRADLEPR